MKGRSPPTLLCFDVIWLHLFDFLRSAEKFKIQEGGSPQLFIYTEHFTVPCAHRGKNSGLNPRRQISNSGFTFTKTLHMSSARLSTSLLCIWKIKIEVNERKLTPKWHYYLHASIHLECSQRRKTVRDSKRRCDTRGELGSRNCERAKPRIAEIDGLDVDANWCVKLWKWRTSPKSGLAQRDKRFSFWV